MTKNYQLSGLTCSGCVAKVDHLLSQIEKIKNVTISLENKIASIEMTSEVPLVDLQSALHDYPKYRISDAPIGDLIDKIPKSWLATYHPLLLIFTYISLLSAWSAQGNLMDFMRYFMAGFFLIFSFFKLLDLRGFAESYQMYDLVAKKIPVYGYVYPFLELSLGVAFFTNFLPFATNFATLILMTISLLGVVQSLLNKQKIRCACLGAVFNLPMSSVTLIEDALMIAMSAVMLFLV